MNDPSLLYSAGFHQFAAQNSSRRVTATNSVLVGAADFA
jgi:hypothetical protein